MFDKIIKCCCSIFLISLNCFSQSNQAPDIDQLAGQFVKLMRTNPHEKIEVFTNKWIYSAGEEVWFKAYCLNALSDRPIHQSKNLFLDIVNDKDSVVSQALMNIKEDKSGGKILLSESLNEGFYWIRAYTRNILKEDTNRIFIKPIYILNPRHSDLRALSSANHLKSEANYKDTSLPQLQLFPEGGSIISGTTATVAFIFRSASGHPLEATGYVTDTRDSTVANFSSSIAGIGKFSFDAWNPRKYVAHIKWANNRTLNYPLPHIDQFASQLSILDQNDQTIHVRISQGDSLYKKNKLTHLLAISRDSVCFAANGSDMYDLNIPKNNFPKGKAILFLFDEQGRIVSQRAVYIDSSNIHVSLTADKNVFGPREKVKLAIAVSGPDNHPINALLSVSVTDDRYGRSAFQSQYPASYLYIGAAQLSSSTTTSSDLKASQAEMDMIMMIQKPLYSEWKYGLDFGLSKSNNIDDDSNFLRIQGRIVNKKNEPLIAYMVDLFSDQKDMFRIDTTDDKGRFTFSLPDFEDGSKFNLKLTNLEGKAQDGLVLFDKSNFPQVSTPFSLKQRFNLSELGLIRESKARQLDTLTYGSGKGVLSPVTVKTDKTAGTSYDESKRVSRFSYIITSEKFQNGDIYAVVNAIKNVPGFNTGISSVVTPAASITTSGTTEGMQPLVVMDGVPQTLSGGDVNSFLLSLDPASIDFIEILKGALTAIYGIQGAGGVILINSVKGRKDIAQIDEKGLTAIYPKGYMRVSSFSEPDYDNKEVRKSSYPDLRSTIYWKGNLLTDASGKASVEFFTADEPSSYTVSLMGVTTNGIQINKETKIVRK
jgi:hypothetical protein